MFETLEIEVKERIGTIRLNSPEKLNSLTNQRLVELVQAARWFDAQPEIRVILIEGEGRAFSAGADLSNFDSQRMTPRQGADLGDKWRTRLKR